MSVNIPEKNESDVALELEIENMFPIDISKLRMLVIQYFGIDSIELKLVDMLVEERKKTYRANMSYHLLEKFVDSHKKEGKNAIIKLSPKSE